MNLKLVLVAKIGEGRQEYRVGDHWPGSGEVADIELTERVVIVRFSQRLYPNDPRPGAVVFPLSRLIEGWV